MGTGGSRMRSPVQQIWRECDCDCVRHRCQRTRNVSQVHEHHESRWRQAKSAAAARQSYTPKALPGQHSQPRRSAPTSQAMSASIVRRAILRASTSVQGVATPMTVMRTPIRLSHAPSFRPETFTPGPPTAILFIVLGVPLSAVAYLVQLQQKNFRG